jgi:hypothetical protein|nr:MAG TPA: hypothetical protein [Caudoviricetes sp.]
MEIKKIIFLDDTYLEDCVLSTDIPKEIAEVSSSFVKLTFDKSTIKYVNLDYIQLIIPKCLKVISSRGKKDDNN